MVNSEPQKVNGLTKIPNLHPRVVVIIKHPDEKIRILYNNSMNFQIDFVNIKIILFLHLVFLN